MSLPMRTKRDVLRDEEELRLWSAVIEWERSSDLTDAEAAAVCMRVLARRTADYFKRATRKTRNR